MTTPKFEKIKLILIVLGIKFDMATVFSSSHQDRS